MRFPLADADCECRGYGYDVFACDGVGHNGWELQSLDVCDCAEKRGRTLVAAGGIPTDVTAAFLFVEDAAAGHEYALQRMRLILDNVDVIVAAPCPVCNGEEHPAGGPECPRCGSVGPRRETLREVSS